MNWNVTPNLTVLTDPAKQGVFRYLTEGAPGGGSRPNGNAFSSSASVDLNGQVLTSDGGTPLFLNQIHLFNDVNDPNRTGIDPVWVGPEYLPRMPSPNDWTTGDGLNTAGFRWLRRHSGTDSATGTDPNTNRNHLTVRLDYQINDSNKVSFTMSREENWAVTGQTGLPAFPDDPGLRRGARLRLAGPAPARTTLCDYRYAGVRARSRPKAFRVR